MSTLSSNDTRSLCRPVVTPLDVLAAMRHVKYDYPSEVCAIWKLDLDGKEDVKTRWPTWAKWFDAVELALLVRRQGGVAIARDPKDRLWLCAGMKPGPLSILAIGVSTVRELLKCTALLPRNRGVHTYSQRPATMRRLGFSPQGGGLWTCRYVLESGPSGLEPSGRADACSPWS